MESRVNWWVFCPKIIKNKSKKTVELVEYHENLKNLDQQIKEAKIIDLKTKKKFTYKKPFRKKKFFKKTK